MHPTNTYSYYLSLKKIHNTSEEIYYGSWLLHLWRSRSPVISCLKDGDRKRKQPVLGFNEFEGLRIVRVRVNPDMNYKGQGQ